MIVRFVYVRHMHLPHNFRTKHQLQSSFHLHTPESMKAHNHYGDASSVKKLINFLSSKIVSTDVELGNGENSRFFFCNVHKSKKTKLHRIIENKRKATSGA